MTETQAQPAAAELAERHCVPCEGGVPVLGPAEIQRNLANLPDWELTSDGKAIRRVVQTKNFLAAMDYFHRIATIAEDEQHHPDLHLTAYRKVTIELTTHAIGGLSDNDFILAAKIDRLPVDFLPKRECARP